MPDDELTPVERTALLTLSARAWDARHVSPVLGDAMAEQVLGALGSAPEHWRMTSAAVAEIALRTSMLDDAVRGFAVEHPDAVVLDLGAGFDARAQRVDPPDGVDWYDVDLPAVARLRERSLPARTGSRAVGASVAESGWAEPIPTGRPVVAVADGLLPFLTEQEIAVLLLALTDRFGTGELLVDDSRWPPLGAWPSPSIRGVARRPAGIEDPRALERWNPRMHWVEERPLVHEPEVARLPPVPRHLARAATHFPAAARTARVLRYRF
ncbi:class I SAM-dependent methyltransferase [Saccharopolyspora cebuensis]|uniref:class I SAM-dependent methyltransferase n=1 Tax=Saccharopolyspora cebuensis TaxID=418759 RepID=UPI0031ED2300